MAGSLRNFQYVADNAAIFLFKADESNTEAVNGTSANIVAANINNFGIPRNVRPRRVYYADAARQRILSAIASTITVYNTPPATIPDPFAGGGATLTLIRKTPERITLYANIDTGLTDGDTPL
jgi:hypothetical protein